MAVSKRYTRASQNAETGQSLKDIEWRDYDL